VAATEMKKYFNSYLAWCKHLDEDGIYKTVDGGRYMWETMHREFTYWNVDKFGEWYRCVQQALTTIQNAKAQGTIDETTYNTLYNRIILERIPILYLAQEYSSYSSVSIEGMSAVDCRQMIKADCELLGITSNGGLGTMAELYAKWKIA
jgi:hypothetical protein